LRLLPKPAAAGTDPEYDEDVFVRARRELTSPEQVGCLGICRRIGFGRDF
jgi:hypothetical protein